VSSKLTTTQLAAAVHSAAIVIRELERNDRTMTYGEFTVAVGLRRPDEPWKASHQGQVSLVLDTTAALAKYVGEQEIVNKRRIVNAQTGQPGTGVDKEPRLVRDSRGN
jgi:hypothetical protein